MQITMLAPAPSPHPHISALPSNGSTANRLHAFLNGDGVSERPLDVVQADSTEGYISACTNILVTAVRPWLASRRRRNVVASEDDPKDKPLNIMLNVTAGKLAGPRTEWLISASTGFQHRK